MGAVVVVAVVDGALIAGNEEIVGHVLSFLRVTTPPGG
jgi:hypothetical protein